MVVRSNERLFIVKDSWRRALKVLKNNSPRTVARAFHILLVLLKDDLYKDVVLQFLMKKKYIRINSVSSGSC